MNKLLLLSVLVLSGCATMQPSDNYANCTKNANLVERVVALKNQGKTLTSLITELNNLPNVSASDLSYSIDILNRIYNYNVTDAKAARDDMYTSCMTEQTKIAANNEAGGGFVGGFMKGLARGMSQPSMNCRTTYGNSSSYTNCY